MVFSNPNGEEAHPMGMVSDKILPANLGGLAARVSCSNPVPPALV